MEFSDLIMDLDCKKITIGTLTFDPQEPVKLSHQKIVINVNDPENVNLFELTLQFKEISKIKELYSINNNLIQFMLCPRKVSYIRAKLQPNYKFSIINKINKSETFFIVHLADDLEKKTEIALQNFFSPLFHEEIQDENNVSNTESNSPQMLYSNVCTDEAKQLQYAINESLKDSKLLEESDVSSPKRCKLSTGEKDHASDDTTEHSNKNCDNFNWSFHNEDKAIAQDSPVHVLRESSTTEQETETEDINYINNNNDGTFVPKEDMTKTILFYPDCNDGIRIAIEDYLCLKRKELIDDVIIDFYLKYLYYEVFTEEQRDRTHIFSTHFFSLYSTKSNFNGWNDDVRLNAQQKRYLRVANMSKDINLFDKDYIVVPIHDDDHWLLAIICFPYLKDAYAVEDENVIVVPTVNGRRKRIETVPILRRPCILVFDSVRGNGSRKTRVIKYLKDYLEHEYIAQQEIDGLEDKDFWKSRILGHSLICPEQQNIFDCGLYVCEFVERFFTQPFTNYQFPMPDMSQWFSEEIILQKREKIAKTLHNLMDNSNGKYEPSSTLPQIHFSKQSKPI